MESAGTGQEVEGSVAEAAGQWLPQHRGQWSSAVPGLWGLWGWGKQAGGLRRLRVSRGDGQTAQASAPAASPAGWDWELTATKELQGQGWRSLGDTRGKRQQWG